MGLELVGGEGALTWKEFEQIVKEDIEAAKIKKQTDKSLSVHTDWLYRGHSSERWGLVTTLERYLK
jgi:hypothetical protein